jgi:hypothetical protein
MRSRWRFPFEAVGAHFEKCHRFNVRSTTNSGDVPAQSVISPALIEIEPSQKSTGQPGTQHGWLYITVTGSPEATKDLAYWMASNVGEYIAFHHGTDFHVTSGFVAAERIAETAEEVEQIGDKSHYVSLSFQEAEDTKPFDPVALTGVKMRREALRALRQFNQARFANGSVDQFLGFFKSLELLYCGHVRGSDSLPCLRDSAELLDIAKAELTSADGDESREMAPTDFEALLLDLVRVRGNCAHLRTRSGYAPGDPRISSDVEPLVPIVQALAAAGIRRRLSASASGGG